MQFENLIGEVAKLAISYNHNNADEDHAIVDQINAAKSALNTFTARLQAVLSYFHEQGAGEKKLRDMATALLNMLFAAVEVDKCWLNMRQLWVQDSVEFKATVKKDEGIDIDAVEQLLTLFKENSELNQLVEKYCGYVERKNNFPGSSGHYAYHDRSKTGSRMYANVVVRNALDFNDLLMAALNFAHDCRHFVQQTALISFLDSPEQLVGTVSETRNDSTVTFFEQRTGGTLRPQKTSSLSGSYGGLASINTKIEHDDPGDTQLRRSNRERKPRVIRD